MNWTERVVADLREGKNRGLTFDGAWQRALKRHPLPNRDRDRREPAADLFAAAGVYVNTEVEDRDERTMIRMVADWSLNPDDGEPFLDAFHRFCGDAWHGRREALAYLSVLLEGGDLFLRWEPMELAA